MRRLNAKHWWFLSGAWFLTIGYMWSNYVQHKWQIERIRTQTDNLHQTFKRFQIRNEQAKPAIIDPERLSQHIDALSKPRFTRKQRQEARQFLSKQLSVCGYRPIQRQFSGGINIEAIKGGPSKTSAKLLIGAHYDTVENSPGADDNASGVAAVIDLACRIMGIETNLAYRFVFFDKEEHGLLGSKAYAQNRANRENLIGAIILEMIGSKCKRIGCQQWPAQIPNWMRRQPGDFIAIVGDMSRPDLMTAFSKSGSKNRPPIHIIPVARAGADFPNSRRSDHAPFWDHGIDAVMVTDTGDFRNKHYHK